MSHKRWSLLRWSLYYQQKNQMWHLFLSKSYLIIGQKSWNIVRHYRRVLRKIAILTNVTPSGIKIIFDYRSKKSKICLILYARFEKKGDYQRKEGAFLGGGVWSSCCTFGQQNHKRLSAKKVKNDSCYFWRILRRIYVKFIWRIRVSYSTGERAFYGSWCSIQNTELFRTKEFGHKQAIKSWTKPPSFT